MKDKAERRRQAEKHKEKTKRLVKLVWHEPELSDDDKFIGIEAGVHSDRCSCPMCQTSRKNKWLKGNRIPVNEQKELEDATEQIEEAEEEENDENDQS